jgi:GT2 family glycosyltransferase
MQSINKSSPPKNILRKLATSALTRIQRALNIAGKSCERTISYLNSGQQLSSEQQLDSLQKYLSSTANVIPYLSIKPHFTVFLEVDKADDIAQEPFLRSLTSQLYKQWNLAIIGSKNSLSKESNSILQSVKGQISFIESPQHAKQFIAQHLPLSDQQHFLILAGSGVFAPHALLEFTRFINLHPESSILYADEAFCEGPFGEPATFYHKPGWSPLLHLSWNYLGAPTAFRLDKVREKLPAFETTIFNFRYDLCLRITDEVANRPVSIPFTLWYNINPADKCGDDRSSTKATYTLKENTAARRAYPIQNINQSKNAGSRIKWKLPSPAPLISIIIPNRDSSEILKKCVDSIFRLSSYPSFEVIICDNGSHQNSTLELYDGYTSQFGERFSVIRHEHPFNFARQTNSGVRQSKGTYCVFLNNDTEVLSPDWLEELIGPTLLPHIGAVCPKLLYSDGSIQHTGMSPITPWLAACYGRNQPCDSGVYFNYLQHPHEVLAATGACILIRKEVYVNIGMLDETFVPNGYGDVELGIKLNQKGLSCAYTPYAVLYHHESKSRGSNIEAFECLYLHRKYASEILNDPFRSPHITDISGFSGNSVYERTDFAPSVILRYLDLQSKFPT